LAYLKVARGEFLRVFPSASQLDSHFPALEGWLEQNYEPAKNPPITIFGYQLWRRVPGGRSARPPVSAMVSPHRPPTSWSLSRNQNKSRACSRSSGICKRVVNPVTFYVAGSLLRLKLVHTMTTILVIDDDESLRDTIGLMLEAEGYRPLLAADGKTGYERAL